MESSTRADDPAEDAQVLSDVELVHWLHALGSDRERRAFPVEAWPLYGPAKPAWAGIIADARARMDRWAGNPRWVLHTREAEGEVAVEQGVPVPEVLLPLWGALAPEGLGGIPLVRPSAAEAILEERGVPVTQRTLRAWIKKGVVGIRLEGRSRGRLWLPLPVVAFGMIEARGWRSNAARYERIEAEITRELLDALLGPGGYTRRGLAKAMAERIRFQGLEERIAQGAADPQDVVRLRAELVDDLERLVYRWAAGEVAPDSRHLAHLGRAHYDKFGSWVVAPIRKRVPGVRPRGGGA